MEQIAGMINDCVERLEEQCQPRFGGQGSGRFQCRHDRRMLRLSGQVRTRLAPGIGAAAATFGQTRRLLPACKLEFSKESPRVSIYFIKCKSEQSS
jgi:hypothetical protein